MKQSFFRLTLCLQTALYLCAEHALSSELNQNESILKIEIQKEEYLQPTMKEVLTWAEKSKEDLSYREKILTHLPDISHDLYSFLNLSSWDNIEDLVKNDVSLLLNYCYWIDVGVYRKWLEPSKILKVPDLINKSKSDSTTQLTLYYFYKNTGAKKLAFQSLQKAAKDTKNITALTALAGEYYLGEIVGKDYKKTADLLLKAIDMGDARAMVELGIQYAYGLGVIQDGIKALELLTKAEKLGMARATINLAMMYYIGTGVPQDYAKAFELFQKTKDLGQARVLYNLGLMYGHGHGVKQDENRAAELFTEAAFLGHSSAMADLAYLYQTGKGVKQDNEKALDLYTQAINLGNEDAMYNLATKYYLGTDGVKQDYKKASELFQKAADLGDSIAMTDLASMYKKGQITGSPDYKNAKKYYEMAIEKGLDAAMISLAQLYEWGKITGSPDYINAKKYYEMAIEKGLDAAMVYLAQLYEWGKITGSPDYKNAKKYYEMAIEKEEPLAMASLGLLYREGKILGTPDYEKAFHLYKRSAILESKKARYALENFFFKISTENRSLTELEEHKSADFVQELDRKLKGIAESQYEVGFEFKTISKEILKEINDLEKIPGYFLTCAKPIINLNVFKNEKIDGLDYLSIQKTDILEKLKTLKVEVFNFYDINSKSYNLSKIFLSKLESEKMSSKEFDVYLVDALDTCKIIDKKIYEYLKEFLIKNSISEKNKIEDTMNLLEKRDNELGILNEYLQGLEKNFREWLKFSAPKRNDLFLGTLIGK